MAQEYRPLRRLLFDQTQFQRHESRPTINEGMAGMQRNITLGKIKTESCLHLLTLYFYQPYHGILTNMK